MSDRRLNNGRPFAWQDKERFRLLRSLNPRTRESVGWTYSVLTHLANDSGDRIFSCWLADIVAFTGHSARVESRNLAMLESLGLLHVSRHRDRSGHFGMTTFELTKGAAAPKPYASPLNELASGADGLQKRSQISGSHVDAVSTTRQLSKRTGGVVEEQKNKKEETTATSYAHAHEDDVSTDAVRREFEQSGFLFWNAHSQAALREFARDLEGTRRALKKAGETNVPANRLIPWVRSFLDREKNPRAAPAARGPRSNRYAPPALRHLEAPPDVWD